MLLGKMHPSEVETPPPSISPPPNFPGAIAGILSGDRKPPLYVYVQRREPHEGPAFLMVPWDQYNARYQLNTGWQDAPDPVRQSDFYAHGNKIHPWANQQIVTSLAIGSREAVMEDRFTIGKLIGYLRASMYQGGQHPSVVRANIDVPRQTTYGSMYEVSGIQPLTGVQNYSSTGFAISPLGTTDAVDGYPY